MERTGRPSEGVGVMGHDVVSAFLDAGNWFLGITGAEQVAARWREDSALAGYTIGGLVGHVAAAVGWLVPLLETTAPPPGTPVLGLGDYLLPFPVRNADDLGSHLHVAARAQGERGAQRGAAETADRFRSRLETIADRLGHGDIDRLIDLRPTLPAAIALADFLRTRVVELVVHGDDLATSIGLQCSPPSDAAAVTIDLLTATARTQHGDVDVIRGLARGERSTGTVFPVL